MSEEEIEIDDENELAPEAAPRPAPAPVIEKPRDPALVETLRQLQKAVGDSAPLHPIDRLVFAALADGADVAEAGLVYRRLRHAFVDWNEMRVARAGEISRLLDPLPGVDARAQRVRAILTRLFDLRGAMELVFLSEMKVTEGRKCLLGIDKGLPRETIDCVLFSTVPGAALVISPEALAEARKRGLVGKSGTRQQLQKRLQDGLPPIEAGMIVAALEALVRPERPAARKRK